MRLALYQPDIPQNIGTILRMAACLGTPVDVIGPTGFDMSDRNLRRAGLDYLAYVDLTRHLSWEQFCLTRSQSKHAGRLILLSSKAAVRLPDFVFSEHDTLLFGRESAGVPDTVRDGCDAAVAIPMKPPLRSLNVAVAAAMVLGEALRQTGGFAV
jgi:tRNA (cytidine/uridine-2'-O-)-methyltransferase